jgi:poly-gamma-glutamate system protein
VRVRRDAVGPPIDERLDPNRTGWIGPEYAGLFTTLGSLEAKRTTTSPDVAALLVHLLEGAGVRGGDTIAVGASGSFPALLAATTCAAQALGAYPVTILSLGASSYGATDPALDLLDLYRIAQESGVLRVPPAAVSPGGEHDTAADMDPTTRQALLARMRGSGVPWVIEPDLRRSVERRLDIYLGLSGRSRTGAGPTAGALRDAPQSSTRALAAFVNVGGADANVGTSPTLLSLRPGLTGDVPLPPPDQRGVLHEMAARGVPVVHLLDVRTWAMRHGLPWDPIPLPEPGTTRIERGGGDSRTTVLVVAAAWLAALIVISVTAAVMIPGRKTSAGPPVR